MISASKGGRVVRLPASRPGQPAAPPPAEPAGAHNVVAIRLQPGETVAVNPAPEPEPASPKREDFDFLGHTFYMASKELSAKLPFIGLTATEYDVWHTMLGAQLKGGIVPITVIKLGERLGIGRKEAGEALARFLDMGFMWLERRGRYRINPRIAFWGSSAEQQRALALMPDSIPEIRLPEGEVRPPRRTRRPKLESL
ncbi:hypothetical protein [Kitasatospora phosalacinea]|uniref:hypothetical protein n=1 Tax=Kitasatospora phosalacinea TaxID=2065 RepID=UPI0025552BE6|nr:hypothetical protein [Kitasatospora phosalacinea]